MRSVQPSGLLERRLGEERLFGEFRRLRLEGEFCRRCLGGLLERTRLASERLLGEFRRQCLCGLLERVRLGGERLFGEFRRHCLGVEDLSGEFRRLSLTGDGLLLCLISCLRLSRSSRLLAGLLDLGRIGRLGCT